MSKNNTAKTKSKRNPGKPGNGGKSEAKTKYQLTVSKDKLAILLRLPKTTIKIIDQIAKSFNEKRTSVIYRIIAHDQRLTESMQSMFSPSE